MSRICILTDSTVQFPSSLGAGEEHVYVIPMHIALHTQLYTDGRDLKPYQLLESSHNGDIPRTLPPSIDEFREMYAYLGSHFNEVIVILTSAQLNPAVQNAQGPSALQPPSGNHLLQRWKTNIKVHPNR